MNDRFLLDWNNISKKISTLLNHAGFEQPLIEASQNISGRERTRDISGVRNNFQTAMMGAAIPWVFYDTISELISRVPEGSKQIIIDTFAIETKRDFEALRINTDGHWQISWEIEPISDDPQYKYIALEWYAPPNHDQAPIVPISIADYIAGCVSLIRKNLVLPGAALLTIAVEAALWNGLQNNGTERSQERITYTPTIWTLRRIQGKFLVTIHGANQPVDAQLDPILEDPNHEFSVSLRRTQATTARVSRTISLEVDSSLVDFLTSDQVETQEKISIRGLSDAIQRSRSQNLPGLQVIPGSIDNTIISLRNNLIHLPPDDNLDEHILIPDQVPICTLSELQNNPRFIKMILYSVVEVINSIHSVI